MLTSAKLRRPRNQKTYFPKLHMGVYLYVKFEVSSIILTNFRQVGGVILHLTSKQTPKKPTQIRANESIEHVKQMKLKNKTQSDIKSLFRS